MLHRWTPNYQAKVFYCEYCSRKILDLQDSFANKECPQHPEKIKMEQELARETIKQLMEKAKHGFIADLKQVCLKHGISISIYQENFL